MTKVNIMVNQRLSLKFVNISFVNKCLKRVQCRHWPVKQITLSLLNLDKGLLDSSAKSPYAGQTSLCVLHLIYHLNILKKTIVKELFLTIAYRS